MLVCQPSRWGRVAVLAPALIVAAAAVAATAHGGYEVAVACAVPPGIAWLYPLITDGLALVAYAATHRLRARSALIYAWLVVVLAAALSGLAQAVYLASGPALDTSPVLRFGVGAWPAIAGAVAAHLVYLLARRPVRVPPALAAPTPATLITRPGSDPLPLPVGPPVHSPAFGSRAMGREKKSSARPVVDTGRAGDRPPPTVEALLASGAGRRKIAQTLGVTEYEARQLIAQHAEVGG